MVLSVIGLFGVSGRLVAQYEFYCAIPIRLKTDFFIPLFSIYEEFLASRNTA